MKAVKTMNTELLNKFVSHIIEARKAGNWINDNEYCAGTYTGVLGWAGVMSPEDRKACVKTYGETMTAKAEAEADKVMQAKAEYWNNTTAKRGGDAATAAEKDPSFVPTVGDFVWGYESGMKAEGGLNYALDDMVAVTDKYQETPEQMKRLVKVEKVILANSNSDEWSDPNILVKGTKDFPGGCYSVDVPDDKDWRTYTEEEKRTFYRCAAAVVDESDRWYLVDSQKYDYARYILFPRDYEVKFAKEVKAIRDENARRAQEEAEREAQEKTDRLNNYKARCAKWEKLMIDVRPLKEVANKAPYRSDERRSADRKLSTARRANISAMVKTAYPGLKFSLRVNHGWGAAYTLTYYDGPTEEEFNDKTDLDLFTQIQEGFDGMTDSTTFDYSEFTDFAAKYMAIDYNGVEVNREQSDEWKAKAVSKILEIAPNSSIRNKKGEWMRDPQEPITSAQLKDICKAFGVDYEKVYESGYNNIIRSAENVAGVIWRNVDLYHEPKTTTKANKADKTADSINTKENSEDSTEAKEEAIDGKFEMVRYSPKCYKLTGDTMAIKDTLKNYGVWNRARRCWFISNKKAASLAAMLGIILTA